MQLVDRAASNRTRARDNDGYRRRHLINKQRRGFARVARCKLITRHFAHPSPALLRPSHSPGVLTTPEILGQRLIDVVELLLRVTDRRVSTKGAIARCNMFRSDRTARNAEMTFQHDRSFPLNCVLLIPIEQSVDKARWNVYCIL